MHLKAHFCLFCHFFCKFCQSGAFFAPFSDKIKNLFRPISFDNNGVYGHDSIPVDTR